MRDDLGRLPKVHERTSVVQAAQFELYTMLSKWIEQHKLTEAEYFMILSSALVHRASQLVATERRTEDE